MSQATLRSGFLGLPKEFTDYTTSKVAILPIPFDGTSTYIKGADKGPEALLEASRAVELYDIETASEPYRMGICTLSPIEAQTVEEMVDRSYTAARKVIDDGKFLMSLGGEHSISYSPIKAYSERVKNLSVLQLDAHSDLRDSYEGSKHNHACIMARAQDLVGNVVSVGIRSQDSSELSRVVRSKMVYADDLYLHQRNSVDWMSTVSKELSENVYITIDLDVFDPGIMPSTGTPEPGGMNWYDVLSLLRLVCAQHHVVGCDIVELCPTDANRAPDFLAARLAYKLLTYALSRR